AGIAEREGGVGSAGPTVRRPERPLAELLLYRCRPGLVGDPLQLGDLLRAVRHPLGGLDRVVRDPSDAVLCGHGQAGRVVFDQLAEDIGEQRAIAANAHDPSYHDAMAHILWPQHVRPPPGRDTRLRPPRGNAAAGLVRKRTTVTYIIAEPCVDLLDKACI